MPGPESDASRAFRARFENQQFSHEWTPANSPTGMGAFSSTYNPKSGQMDVTVKTHFEFSDHDYKWDPNDHLPWRDQAIDTLQKFWSGRYFLQCQREHWQKYKVSVNFHVVPTTKSDCHVFIKIGKTWPDAPSKGGGVGNWTTQPYMGLDDLTLYPKDTREVRASIFNTRRIQLETMLKQMNLNVLKFGKDSANLSATDVTRLYAFARYYKSISTDDVTGIQIRVWGSTAGNDGVFQRGLGKKRAEAVAACLQSAMIPDGVVEPRTSNGARAKATLKEVLRQANPGHPVPSKVQGVCIFIHVPSSVAQLAEQNYIVICHEYGHMLGLPDEYMGLLHPNLTPRIQLDTLIPGTEAIVERTATTQEARLAKQQEGMAGMAAQNPKIRMPTTLDRKTIGDGATTVAENMRVGSASIMYGGMEVYPAHYLTIWSALAQMTSMYVDPKHWKLIPGDNRGARYFKT